MKYAYVRVSSISQNIDRQMEEMYKLGYQKNKFLSTNKVVKILIDQNISY